MREVHSRLRVLRGQVALNLWVALLLAGCVSHAGRPLGLDEAALVDAFTALHTRVHQVYAVGPDRDALHALLAESFYGEALTREYVQQFGTLSRMQALGTEVEVLGVVEERVEVVEGSAEEARLRVDWRVEGIVTHGAHSHARTNRYSAIYTVARTPVGPRIVDTRMRDLARVEAARGEAELWRREREQAGESASSPLDLLRGGWEAPADAPAGGGGAP